MKQNRGFTSFEIIVNEFTHWCNFWLTSSHNDTFIANNDNFSVWTGALWCIDLCYWIVIRGSGHGFESHSVRMPLDKAFCLPRPGCSTSTLQEFIPSMLLVLKGCMGANAGVIMHWAYSNAFWKCYAPYKNWHDYYLLKGITPRKTWPNDMAHLLSLSSHTHTHTHTHSFPWQTVTLTFSVNIPWRRGIPQRTTWSRRSAGDQER